MTSKEAVKVLKGYLGIDAQIIIDALIPIAEDLEILEIIKNHIITTNFEYGDAFDDCNKISFTAEIIQPKDFTNRLNGIHYTTVKVDNGFEKIREWLLNEK